MADFAKESGHYYKRDGSPCYTTIGKNGKERNTTLRDARTMDLLPSVTTIMKEASAPGLERWKMDQVLMAALTLTREVDESDDAFKKRIFNDAAEHGKKAAEKGTLIHGWIEKGLCGESVPPEAIPFCNLANTALGESCPSATWSHEKSFATNRYAGKVDLNSSQRIVIDIKTNEKPVDDAKLWDNHIMQLAAYSVGLFDGELVNCGILFINHKGMEAKIVWATREQLEKGLQMFGALVSYWYAKTQLGAK